MSPITMLSVAFVRWPCFTKGRKRQHHTHTPHPSLMTATRSTCQAPFLRRSPLTFGSARRWCSQSSEAVRALSTWRKPLTRPWSRALRWNGYGIGIDRLRHDQSDPKTSWGCPWPSLIAAQRARNGTQVRWPARSFGATRGP